MKNTFVEYAARPKRYDNIDGAGEMYMGVMLLGFALISYLQDILPPHSRWMNGFGALLFTYAILIPVLAGGYWGVKAIKRHITFPRTGYVSYAARGKPRWVALAIIAAIGAVGGCAFGFLMAVARKHDSMGTAGAEFWRKPISLQRTLILAMWVPVYAFWISRMGGGHKWKWLVVLFMAIGLRAICLTTPGDYAKLGLPVELFVGSTWFASGAATFCLYIRHTQPPTASAE